MEATTSWFEYDEETGKGYIHLLYHDVLPAWLDLLEYAMRNHVPIDLPGVVTFIPTSIDVRHDGHARLVTVYGPTC